MIQCITTYTILKIQKRQNKVSGQYKYCMGGGVKVNIQGGGVIKIDVTPLLSAFEMAEWL